jgi:tetratricopeptide (TPR) repeat protein
MSSEEENTSINDDNDDNVDEVVVDGAPLVVHDSHSIDLDFSDDPPSMTLSLFLYWVIPLLFIAIFSRKVVDTSIPTIPIDSPVTSSSQPSSKAPRKSKASSQQRSNTSLQFPTQWPTAYREELETIRRRRRRIDGFAGGVHSLLQPVVASGSTGKKSTRAVSVEASGEVTELNSAGHVRHGRKDPARESFHQKIQLLRAERSRDPNNLFLAIALAETMRIYDLQFHEGGTYEAEALSLYDEIISTVLGQRNQAISAGQATDECSLPDVHSVNDEVAVEYSSKSLDGLLCSLYTSKGKLFFMADMFEKAVEAYDACLHGDIQQPHYLDALNAKASSLIVLGKLEEAGRDFLSVIQRDSGRLFIDAFSGLERVLEAMEDAVPGGWDSVLPDVEMLVQSLQFQLSVEAQSKTMLAGALNRLHHFLFTYHDVKTKNYSEAFRHLSEGFEHKLSVLTPWAVGSEKAKVTQTKSIFQKGFWPSDTGSKTKKPIFIIGFVRSGSTLLERILDAHPLIAGTGENSVFNGRLGDIRDRIVEASNQGKSMADLTRQLADEVVEEMERRHAVKEGNIERKSDDVPSLKPERLVDKMLTNYYNVGLIQLLYPNALILHVAREPMDSIFSAYKHEFPSGTLDYTSDYNGLAELYHVYRDVMEHWDNVLPGRIVHIRYEDMVKDFDGTARAIVRATELPWHDDVLQFHKKKHAVNTLSSTQVRKGVYTNSLKAWMRYEAQLQPLVELIGERVEFNFKTTLPGYIRNETANEAK